MGRLEKEIFTKVKRANLKYNLIEDGDRIAVGLSGGKDSMVLLHALGMLQKYTPLRFDVIAITIDLGLGADYGSLKAYCTSQSIPMIVEPTNIGRIVFIDRREENPCSLCANLRRGALNRVAKACGCNKVALAHHLDDAVTTFFMSMAFEGQLRSFKPATYLTRVELTVIRPLVYVPEKTIIKLCHQLNPPVIANLCPAVGKTKRALIQEWIDLLEKSNPRTKQRFLTALEKAFWS